MEKLKKSEWLLKNTKTTVKNIQKIFLYSSKNCVSKWWLIPESRIKYWFFGYLCNWRLCELTPGKRMSLSLSVSVSVSICLYLSLSVSLCLSVCLSVCLSLSLSNSTFFWKIRYFLHVMAVYYHSLSSVLFWDLMITIHLLKAISFLSLSNLNLFIFKKMFPIHQRWRQFVCLLLYFLFLLTSFFFNS